MNCQQCHEHLIQYLVGELDPTAHQQVQAALEVCPDCRAELASLERIQRSASILPRPEPSARMGQNILRQARLAAAAKTETARTIPLWLAWAGPTLGFAIALLAVGVGIRSASDSSVSPSMQAPVASDSTGLMVRDEVAASEPSVERAAGEDMAVAPQEAAAPERAIEQPAEELMAALPDPEEARTGLNELPTDLDSQPPVATNAARPYRSDEGRIQARSLAEPEASTSTVGLGGVAGAGRGGGGPAGERNDELQDVASAQRMQQPVRERTPTGAISSSGSTGAAPPASAASAAPAMRAPQNTAAELSAAPAAAPAVMPSPAPTPGPNPGYGMVAPSPTYPAADERERDARRESRPRRNADRAAVATAESPRSPTPADPDMESTQVDSFVAQQGVAVQEESAWDDSMLEAEPEGAAEPDVETLLMEGRREEAVALATARLQQERSPFNLYWAGRAWLDSDDEPRAIDMLDEMMQRFPSDPLVNDLHDRIFESDRPATRSRMRRPESDQGL